MTSKRARPSTTTAAAPALLGAVEAGDEGRVRRSTGRRARADDTVPPVLISEVMTHAVVSADVGDTLRHVGGLMRERNVGSVVVCDGGRPWA